MVRFVRDILGLLAEETEEYGYCGESGVKPQHTPNTQYTYKQHPFSA